MLNTLRTMARSWIAAVFIGLLVISFAVWGISDIFTGGVRNSVAVIGKERISVQDFQRQFRRVVAQRANATDGAFNQEMARAMGVDRQLLNDRILKSALDQRAAALKLGVHDTLLAEELGTFEAFRDPVTKQFSRPILMRLLSQNKMSLGEFESELTSELLRRQLVGPITAGAAAPKTLVAQRAQYLAETRKIAIVTIPESAVAKPADPPEDTLRAFFEERKERYAAPEYRAITVFSLTLTDLLPDVTVSEEDVKAEYEAKRDTLRTPETRMVVELAAPDEAAAAAAVEKLKGGGEPAKIAEELGLTKPNVYADAKREDFFDPAIAEAAFALAEPGAAGPVKGQLSWAAIKVEAITPARETRFEDARADIRARLSRAAAEAKLDAQITAFDEARAKGAALEEAAEAAKVPLATWPPVDRGGADMKGGRIPALADRPQILEAAFAQPADLETELAPIEGGEDEAGYFALRVESITPAAPRAFESVKDAARHDWTLKEMASAFEKMLEQARTALEQGKPAAEAAKAASPLAVTSEVTVARRRAGVELGPALAGAAFGAKLNEVVVAAAKEGTATAAARVEAITPGEPPAPAEIEAGRKAIADELAADLDVLFRQSLNDAYRVRVNEELFKRAVGASEG